MGDIIFVIMIVIFVAACLFIGTGRRLQKELSQIDTAELEQMIKLAEKNFRPAA